MADKMQFDLVSPERMLASAQVSAVDLPAAEGDMRAMPDHAPMVVTLRPGIIRAEGDKETLEYVVTGGFVEVNGTSVSVLAETAFDSKNADKDALQALLREAEEQAKAAEPAKKDLSEKFAADLAHLLENMV